MFVNSLSFLLRLSTKDLMTFEMISKEGYFSIMEGYVVRTV